MSSYYDIFKDTEFTIQNTDSNINIYKLIKSSYQNEGNVNDLIYEDMNDISKQQFSKKETDNKNQTRNSKFRKSCQQPIIQNFKQPMIQIGGFYIQL